MSDLAGLALVLVAVSNMWTTYRALVLRDQVLALKARVLLLEHPECTAPAANPEPEQ